MKLCHFFFLTAICDGEENLIFAIFLSNSNMCTHSPQNAMKIESLLFLLTAICDDKTNYNGACNIYYHNDYQLIRGNNRRSRSSGGSCYGPDYCIGCNDGFYADGPYCRSK